MGEQKLNFDLTVPYKYSLRVALAVRALPGACQSLSAMCCESNVGMSHRLAMPREATQPSAGQSFLSINQLRSDIAMLVALSL